MFLFLAFINFALQLVVIYTQSRYLKGLAPKSIVLLSILATLATSVFFDGFTYFMYQGGGSGAVPFPIFYIINIVSVFWQREPKMD